MFIDINGKLIFCKMVPDKKKIQISGHRKGPRPSTNTTSMYEKSKTHVNRTYSRTYWFNIYRFTYRYTVLLYTTCTDELFVCVHNSYKRDTHTHTHTHTHKHTHTDIALYIYRFMYRYTVLLYTTVHWCTTCHYINRHLWCTHYARISCTAVR